MHPSDEEIKIVEKIKFWEEQEKINGVLVERLLHLNKEMAVIMAENELIKKQAAETISQLEEISKENSILKQIGSQNTDKLVEFASRLEKLSEEKTSFEKMNSRNKDKISEMEKKLASLSGYMERLSNPKHSQSGEFKKTKRTGIRATHIAFMLSMLAIILSVISLLV